MYDDEIVVIVKNEENGVSAEIPLSQVIGRPARDCTLSAQRCAVYDPKGNVLLTLCKPIDFIIEKADRKTMVVVGKTNKELVKAAEERSGGLPRYNKNTISVGINHKKAKQKRYKRYEQNKKHHQHENGDNNAPQKQ